MHVYAPFYNFTLWVSLCCCPPTQDEKSLCPPQPNNLYQSLTLTGETTNVKSPRYILVQSSLFIFASFLCVSQFEIHCIRCCSQHI